MIKNELPESFKGETFSDKRKFSDLKRVAALQSRHNEDKQRRAVIKNALSNVDNKTTVNKKTIFSQDDVKDELFLENDEDDFTDFHTKFEVAPQFEGKRGRQLWTLQSRFGNDDRFRIDSRFAENTDDEDEVEPELNNSEKPSDEYQTNMQILQRVLHVETDAPCVENKRLFRDTSSLRYDPTKKDAGRFKRVVEEKNGKKVEEYRTPDAPPEVSKERFYDVSKNFQENLKQPSSGSFTFLQSVSNGSQTSDDEEEPMQIVTTATPKTVALKTDGHISRENTRKPFSHPVQYLPVNRFFIGADDERLSQGVNFFCRQKDMDEIQRDWLKGRENVQRIFQLKSRRFSRRKRQKIGRRK